MATCIVALSTHTLKVVRFSQSAMNQPGQSGKGLLQFGGFAMIFSFLMMIFENWEISIFSCFGGIFSLVAGAIMAGSAALTGADDQKMVLKQGADGSWGWVNSDGSPVNTNIPGVINQASAAQYNDQSTQILSRVIKEVREGKPLQNLQSSELSALASAYGVQGGTNSQKISALNNSALASKALKLGAGVAAVGAVGAASVGGAKMAKNVRDELKKKALEEKKKLESKAAKEADKLVSQAKDVVSNANVDLENNLILDQLRKEIENKKLTPEILMQLADLNSDNKIDAVEITGALTAATGFSVPVFIVQDALKQFDLDKDGSLDIAELTTLWKSLGFNVEDEFDDSEIEQVFEEVDADEGDDQTTEIVDDVPEVVEEQAPIPVNIELSQGIDTALEKAIVELENVRLSSERRSLMEAQTMEHMVSIKITKKEKTLLGGPIFRGGTTLQGLIDGGPYNGLVKIPVAFEDVVGSHKEGDSIRVMARLVDFSPSLKRPVLEAREVV